MFIANIGDEETNYREVSGMNIQNGDKMQIIKEARKLSKRIKKEGWNTDMKIAVLGSSSIQHWVMILRYMLYKDGIQAEIYEGEYNGITMDVFDEKSPLYRFAPDIVILITHYLDIKEFPVLLEKDEEIRKLLDNTLSYYENVWKELKKIKGVQVLQSNFAFPSLHILGNLEGKEAYSKINFYRKINETLFERSPDFVTIVDVELLAESVGKYQWFDYSAYFLNKLGCKMEFLPEFVEQFEKQILAFKGKTRKCLVLDLDNTLWGGVVGDDGYDGIQLDPNHAIGEAFRYFQSYLLELKQRGIILAVCSKNNEEIAKEPFEKNKNMILRLEDISCFVANWEDKVSNVKRISNELNIGIDSLVFFDDNPAEREIIRKYLPEVHVVDVPQDPALYTLQLDKEGVFEWLQITKEDLMRSNSYIQNKNRANMAQQFSNYDEYLQALEMEGVAGILTFKDVGRFTQLLNKSNQFNLRTQRYTETEISGLLADKNARCIYVSLKDKFSEYGIISCAIVKKIDEKCFIESWVMSCRVLKRNVEGFMFCKIIEEAKAMGCLSLYGEYIPTAKNAIVSDLYKMLGFDMVDATENIKKYTFDLDRKFNNKIYIKEV